MINVDLRKQPYNLDDEGVKWVEETIKSMTLEEKIGQLFINMGASRDEEYLKGVLDNYHIGGVRYNPGKAEEVYEQNKILQENSKIPLLIAANTEMGGNGACTDGTYIGNEVKIAATNDKRYAYEMGRVSGVEAAAIGCNWSFAPIVDINRNWRNPIISTRTWSLELSLEYMRGIMESGIAPAAKHFPGDGIDERDQHLSFAPNSLSVEEWDATFGRVYSGLFEAGLPSIMAGHIALPEYVKYFNPEATTQEIYMPATLSKYVLTDLLRGKMKFNGLVVTDASHMVAMTSAMKRSEMLPTAIAAGSDLFLFFNDPDEDFEWMMEGYKAIAKEVSDKAITLVKNTQDVLPIAPEKTKRVLLVEAKGFDGGFGKFIEIMGGAKKKPVEIVKELLEAKGFDVEIWESPIDKIMKLPKEEMAQALGNVYAGKRPIAELTSKYDLIINIANVNASVDQRLQWPPSKGTPDIPFYVNEIPTIFISVKCPFHLADVPQVKTYINTYDDNQQTLEALVEKLVGNTEFKGISPVDAFCGFGDTRF